MRTRALALVAASLAAAWSVPAAACGFCAEDRVAAVYDAATVERAVRGKRHVAFFEMESAAKIERRTLSAALEGAGAVRGSTRLSLPDRACSIVYDPRRTDLRRLVSAAGGAGVALTPLRIIDEGGKLREP